jgi:hypothetical protein
MLVELGESQPKFSEIGIAIQKANYSEQACQN